MKKTSKNKGEFYIDNAIKSLRQEIKDNNLSEDEIRTKLNLLSITYRKYTFNSLDLLRKKKIEQVWIDYKGGNL